MFLGNVRCEGRWVLSDNFSVRRHRGHGDGFGGYVDLLGGGSDSSGRPRRSCSRGAAVPCVQDDARLSGVHLEAVDPPRCSRPDLSEGGDLLAAI